MRTMLALLFLACFVSFAAPEMMTRDGGKTVSMPLREIELNIDLYGRLAHVKTTMTFENPLRRTTEGRLVMPLPERAEVIGYALKIDKKMVDGVAVEQSHARKAFEDIVARGVDPGLVEKMRGNIFSTRVFPFRAQQTRTMMLRYAFDFTGKAELRVPFDFANKTKVKISVRVIEESCTARATVEGKKLNFLQGAAILSGTGADWKGALTISVQDAKPVIAEKMPNGDVYYAAMLTARKREPDLEAIEALAVYWDASYSRINSDLEVEKKLLLELIRRTKPKRVQLVLLRAEAAEPLKFSGDRNGVAELTRNLDAVVYDGASNLSKLPAAKADLALLFSDGFENRGADGSPLTCKLHSISSASLRDAETLQRIAFRSGGQHVNLREMSLRKAINAILGSSAVFRGSTAKDAWPRMPRPVVPGLVLVGKLNNEAEITVDLGTEKVSFAIPQPHGSYDGFLKSIYGLFQLKELNLEQKENKEKIIAVGQAHHLPTRYTSLLVLENLRDYQKYEIRPPDGLPEYQQQYDTWLAKKKAREQTVAERVRKTMREEEDARSIRRSIVNVSRMLTLEEKFLTNALRTLTPAPVRGPLPADVQKASDALARVTINPAELSGRSVGEVMQKISEKAREAGVLMEYAVLQKPEKQIPRVVWQEPEEFLKNRRNSFVRQPFGSMDLDFGEKPLTIQTVLERLNALDALELSMLDGAFIVRPAGTPPVSLTTLKNAPDRELKGLPLAGTLLRHIDQQIAEMLLGYTDPLNWCTAVQDTDAELPATAWLELGRSKVARAAGFLDLVAGSSSKLLGNDLVFSTNKETFDLGHFRKERPELVEKKLRQLRLARISFEETPISTVLEYLRNRSRILDKKDGLGVNFLPILHKQPRGYREPLVTIDLQNVRLADVVTVICAKASLYHSTDDAAILLSRWKEPLTPSLKRSADHCIDNIVLPKISFEETPLSTCLEYLANRTNVLSKGECSFLPVMSHDLDGRGVFTCDFDKIPLPRIVEYMAMQNLILVTQVDDIFVFHRNELKSKGTLPAEGKDAKAIMRLLHEESLGQVSGSMSPGAWLYFIRSWLRGNPNAERLRGIAWVDPEARTKSFIPQGPMASALRAWGLGNNSVFQIKNGVLLFGKEGRIKDYKLPELPTDAPAKTLRKIRTLPVAGSIAFLRCGGRRGAAENVIAGINHELRGKLTIEINIKDPDVPERELYKYRSPILAYDLLGPCTLEEVIKQICASSNIQIQRIEKDKIVLEGTKVLDPDITSHLSHYSESAYSFGDPFGTPGAAPGSAGGDDAFGAGADDPFAAEGDDIVGGTDEGEDAFAPAPHPLEPPAANQAGEFAKKPETLDWRSGSWRIAGNTAKACYQSYLTQRERYSRSVLFYVDTVLAIATHDKKTAKLIIGTLLDLDPAEDRLIRLAAWLYDHIAARDDALQLYEHRFAQMPDDPSSHLDLIFAQHSKNSEHAAKLNHELMIREWAWRHNGLSKLACIYATTYNWLPNYKMVQDALKEARTPGIIITAKWLDPDQQLDLLIREPSGGFVEMRRSLFGSCSRIGQNAVVYAAKQGLEGPVEIHLTNDRNAKASLVRLEILRINGTTVTTETDCIRLPDGSNVVFIKKLDL